MSTPQITPQVTITGPNAHGGMFHVHATGCADLSRGVYRSIPRNIERYEEEHSSIESIVFGIFDNGIMDENPELGWEDYLSELHIFPCVNLPLAAVAK